MGSVANIIENAVKFNGNYLMPFSLIFNGDVCSSEWCGQINSCLLLITK